MSWFPTNCVEENPTTKTKLDIAKEFKTPQRIFATVQINREKFEEKNKLSSKSKRAKSCELKDVDECVLTWLKQCREKNSQ